MKRKEVEEMDREGWEEDERGASILVCFVGSLVKGYHPPTVKR